MYVYVYIISNPSYPKNVHKIELTKQNKVQLEKRYNKFYLTHINIISVHIVRSQELMLEMMQHKLKNNFVDEKNMFIDCKISKLNTIVSNIVKKINEAKQCKYDVIKYLDRICVKKEESYIYVNELYDIVNKCKNIEYIEFIYELKQKIKLINIDNRLCINGYIFKHKQDNVYCKFKEKHGSNHKLFKRWFNKKYPYLKCPYKATIIKNIKK